MTEEQLVDEAVSGLMLIFAVSHRDETVLHEIRDRLRAMWLDPHGAETASKMADAFIGGLITCRDAIEVAGGIRERLQ